jgi:hypothetical protein
MNKNLCINPFFAHAARWLFTVSAVFTLYAHAIHEGQIYIQSVCEKAVVSNLVTVSEGNPAPGAVQEQPGVDPAFGKMPEELVMSDNAPPLEKETLAVSSTCLYAVHGRKAERRFHPIILEAANRHQIDPDLVRAIIMVESSYNPKAISKKGAQGLMQLMPRTAEALGVEDVFDPEHNINGGVKYFKQLLIQFDGDIKLALAAYNAGSGNVRRYQGIPPFKATKHYVKKVFEYYHSYKELAGGMNRA